MREFAHAYGGYPAADFPWPLVVSGVEEFQRFSARRQLEVLQGVQQGVGTIFGGGLAADLAEDELKRAAWSLKRTEPRMALVQSGRKD